MNPRSISYELLASLVIFQYFKVFFIDFSHVKIDISLPFFTLIVRLITSLWTGASVVSVVYVQTILNYAAQASWLVSPLIFHVCHYSKHDLIFVRPQIHYSMCISAMLSCWIYYLLVGQHVSGSSNTGTAGTGYGPKLWIWLVPSSSKWLRNHIPCIGYGPTTHG
jgi:hypothetical protein